jgi:hypothetical protein
MLKCLRAPHFMQVRYVSLCCVKGLFIFTCQHPKIRVSQRIGVDADAEETGRAA